MDKKEYYQKNKQRILEYQKEYYKNNYIYIRQYQSDYWKKYERKNKQIRKPKIIKTNNDNIIKISPINIIVSFNI